MAVFVNGVKVAESIRGPQQRDRFWGHGQRSTAIRTRALVVN